MDSREEREGERGKEREGSRLIGLFSREFRFFPHVPVLNQYFMKETSRK